MGYYEVQAQYKIVNQFCQYMAEQGRSHHTIDQRKRLLRRFAEDVGLGADAATTENWLLKRKLKPKTLSCSISNLHLFFVWAIENGIAETDPTVSIKPPHVPRPAPRPIPEKELAYALSKADPRNRCWLLLGAFAGLKCQEIAVLNREDVLEGGWLHIAASYGQQERIVPMHEAVEQALEAYGLPDSGPLFTRHGGKQSHAEDVSQRLGKFLRGLGIQSSSQNLRHYFGAQTLRACHDIRVVQELMGHKDVETTRAYKKFDAMAGKQAVASMSLVTF